MEFKKVEKVAIQKNKETKLHYGMFNVAQDLGREMSKEQLINIIKELDWCITQNVDVETYNDITRQTLVELGNNETFESEGV